ncbi:hypothetical protein [Elizabethkingia sp. JS20170427COW]|uniref:hypothetical protein n=1 Tax=Elizabethkingia sp. JS20170427COW TaxID=2583851 RepID=UPI0011100CB1|nr:hypothetical protein [Elizabethkingia sp. JS20170427COW]QCX54122.1 hypothetical protein FGE20_10415 [Elizabethkingia sp. JS20170427COW]
MTTEEQQFLQFWENIKKKGRLKYALKNGLVWGVFSAFFLFLFQYFVLKAEDKDQLWMSAFINTIALLITGIALYYFWIWTLNEKKYLRIKFNQPN